MRKRKSIGGGEYKFRVGMSFVDIELVKSRGWFENKI